MTTYGTLTGEPSSHPHAFTVTCAGCQLPLGQHVGANSSLSSLHNSASSQSKTCQHEPGDNNDIHSSSVVIPVFPDKPPLSTLSQAFIARPRPTYDPIMDNAAAFYRILTSISLLPTTQRSMSDTFWRVCELLAQQEKHDDSDNAGAEAHGNDDHNLSFPDISKFFESSSRKLKDYDLDLARLSNLSINDSAPIDFDDPCASIINFKPNESLRITCLTIGSRGDVQPYIALCKGLLAEGHKPRIATHREFEPWVRAHGIDFAPVEGDPAELMRICVENGMFTYSFLKEASLKFRGWIDDLLSSAWVGCQDSDVLIESPSAMGGIHIAEALRIPYFRAFTMPWTRTRTYPHAFAVPDHKIGGAYNYMTYVMFDNVFWKAIAGQVNRWRKKELGLRSTNLDKMQPNKVPFLYNFSPSVVPPPADYGEWIHVTGYWFLDEGSNWTPPEDLLAFIKKARDDRKKLVYIGFGSIVVSDPTALTKTVIESVVSADVRCILSKGWSDRLGDPASAKTEVPLPPQIHQITAAPHDWLFAQVDAVAHHGGAGTTGASLRAGVPTIVKPFFGDQFFFGTRVEDLGVGILMKKLNVNAFTRALWEVTNSERIIIKAKLLGEKIRKVRFLSRYFPSLSKHCANATCAQENGVEKAIQCLYRDLEYASTLVLRRSMGPDTPSATEPPETPTAENHNWEDDLDGIEDTWTFVGHSDTDMEASQSSKGRESEFDLRSSAAAATGTSFSMAHGEDDGEEDVAR